MAQPWMIIGAITFVVALFGIFIRPRDVAWANRLDRPKWLFFEPAIPFIWTIVFACGAGSATLVWNANPGSLKTWFLMGFFLLVEVVTVTYIPATLRMRSLLVGTTLGAIGCLFAAFLALAIWSISHNASLLLLPYLLWTPVGTYTTRRMVDLNPEAA